MKQINKLLEHFGSAVILCLRSFAYLPSLPLQWRRLIEQCYLIGYTTFPIVAILSFFIGSVLALQAGYSLAPVAAQDFIGSLVGLSLARELAPVMTAILVAGRVGSAIAAELATMKVYQEVDALVTMNIPPERILVMPRLVAILIMMPVLTVVANLIGWIGGAIVAQNVDFIQLDTRIYFQGIQNFVKFRDILDGLIKAEIFGFVTILVACNVGLRTTGGPREIGGSVTRAVVISLILILVLDYFVTSALMNI
jgi:phospholipid/cholesterol/gamma-HCH transport system permease protein